jgi:hypothetical protein
MWGRRPWRLDVVCLASRTDTATASLCLSPWIFVSICPFLQGIFHKDLGKRGTFGLSLLAKYVVSAAPGFDTILDWVRSRSPRVLYRLSRVYYRITYPGVQTNHTETIVLLWVYKSTN